MLGCWGDLQSGIACPWRRATGLLAPSKDLVSSPGGFLHRYMGGSHPTGRRSHRSASCLKNIGFQWFPCESLPREIFVIHVDLENGWGESQYRPWFATNSAVNNCFWPSKANQICQPLHRKSHEAVKTARHLILCPRILRDYRTC